MEFSYEDGRIIGEPVQCPNGEYLKMRFLDFLNKIPGLEVCKGSEPDPSCFIGISCMYDLVDIELLGEGSLVEGLLRVGQAWYQIPSKDICIAPLTDQIFNLRDQQNT